MTASTTSSFCVVADVSGVIRRARTTLPGGRRATDRSSHEGSHQLGAEIQWRDEFHEVNRTRGDVLKMNWQLRLNVPFQAAYPPGRLQLLHGVVPLLPGLLFRLIGPLRSRVLDSLFLFFGFRGGNKANHLARTQRQTRP